MVHEKIEALRCRQRVAALEAENEDLRQRLEAVKALLARVRTTNPAFVKLFKEIRNG